MALPGVQSIDVKVEMPVYERALLARRQPNCEWSPKDQGEYRFQPGDAKRSFDAGLARAKAAEQNLLSRLRDLPNGDTRAAKTKDAIDRMQAFIGCREYHMSRLQTSNGGPAAVEAHLVRTSSAADVRRLCS